jgi:hypothetical protein
MILGQQVKVPVNGEMVSAVLYHQTDTTATALVGHYAWWHGKLTEVRNDEVLTRTASRRRMEPFRPIPSTGQDHDLPSPSRGKAA